MTGQDRNKNKCIIRNVTDYILNSFTLDAQGIMPGHDHNENQCVFCNDPKKELQNQIGIFSISRLWC